MAPRPFRTLLRNQIVVPLLVVTVSAALLVTFAGVSRLTGIVDSWYEGDADQAAQGVHQEFDDVALTLAADAKSIAQDPVLDSSLRAGKTATASLRLEELVPSTAPWLVVLGPNGEVVARTSGVPASAGSSTLPAHRGADSNFTTFLNLGGVETISGLQDTDVAGRSYTVLVARAIDEKFLRDSFGGAASAVVLSTGDGPGRRVIASYVGTRVAGESITTTMTVDATRELVSRLAPSSTALAPALAAPGTTARFDSAGEPYAARSEVISFGAGGSVATRQPPADPTEATMTATVVVSNRAASDAGKTTTMLITFWSIAGALVLTVLGAVLARRVSDPLTTLAESARRVADGDFTAKVALAGASEVVELGDTFNAMTDSLRERTESLTKKLLELATLYEMSRALGSTLDLDILLDSVLDSALRIFGVDSGYVMLRDRESARLDLRCWRGGRLDEKGERPERSAMSDWVVSQGRPLVFNPPADGEVTQQVDTVTGAVAALCVPFISSEGVIGAIAVGTHDRKHRFSSDDVRLLSTIANHVTMAVGNIELFSSLQEAYLATVRSLAAAVDAKDPYTRGHSDRVAEFSRAIAERMGMSHEQCTALEMAAYLHDIGKIGVGEDILRKPGALSPEERGIMRHHPLIGAGILKPVAFPWPITPVVRHHHEHFDGKGYPAGLTGDEIPMLARILAVADAYEAMMADRPYRAGRSSEDAIVELRVCAGTQFDPRVVDAFIDVLEQGAEISAAEAMPPVADLQREEVRAIFVAITDGMARSYLRLSGPRLASRLQSDMNAWFAAQGLSLALSDGHLKVARAATGTAPEIEDMRQAIRHLAELMAASTGASLVDHFYEEAVEGLSERMRRLANDLGLYRRG
jgi:HD-GYP domain-containing protein (c-di-GMP phosphodiesterase class II)/HAMP domain-containing protein